mmetsp:Transcript_13557/g.19925  ORF Transcript_13557/g.19925 Transcript_13557/m.19925 type:complete len:260 (+) Transcript_13557:83-862(+)
MSEDGERFDGVLLNIARQAGSIDNILDAFFGFLQRKTDFFTGAQDEQAAEALIMKYYKKHWKVGQKRRQEQQEKNRIADEERKRRAEEKRVKDEEEYRKLQEEKKAKGEEKIQEVTDEEAERIKAGKKGDTVEAPASSEEASKEVANDDAEDEDNKDPPPAGNGGQTDKYTWTQTLSALEVHVPVRPGVKAKQVVCDIQGEKLKVGVKGEELILDGKLHSKVKPDDCMWTLVDHQLSPSTTEMPHGIQPPKLKPPLLPP